MTEPVESETDTVDELDSGNNGRNNKTVKEPFNLKKKIISSMKLLTVEPSLIMYLLSIDVMGPAMYNFYLEKACRSDLKYPQDVCMKVLSATKDNNATIEAITSTSIALSKWTLWKQPLLTAITVIFLLFIGAWSDRSGNRKAMILLPIIGEVFYNIGLIFGVYFMEEWPLWVIGMIEITAALFTGGFTVAMAGYIGFLAATTTKESRTARVGIFFFAVNVTPIVIPPITGYLTKFVGYYSLFGVSTALYVINVIYVYFRIHNIEEKKSKGTLLYEVGQFFHPKNIWETISILFTSRGILLAQIIVACFTELMITGVAFGEEKVSGVYALNKHGMDIFENKINKSIAKVISLVGLTVAIFVFSKRLHFHDTWLGMISTTSNIAASIAYGLAPTKIYYMAASLLDIFGSSIGTIALKSLTTKLVEQDKVGKIVSLLAFVDTTMPSIFGPIYDKMLTYTLRTQFIGSIYLMSAALTVPTFILFLVQYMLYKRKKRDLVRNPEIKEMHIYTNDITSL